MKTNNGHVIKPIIHLCHAQNKTVTAAGIDRTTWQVYKQRAELGTLPLRIVAMLSAASPDLNMMLKAGSRLHQTEHHRQFLMSSSILLLHQSRHLEVRIYGTVPEVQSNRQRTRMVTTLATFLNLATPTVTTPLLNEASSTTMAG